MISQRQAIAEGYIADMLSQAIKDTAWAATQVFSNEVDGLDTLERIQMADKIEALAIKQRLDGPCR